MQRLKRVFCWKIIVKAVSLDALGHIDGFVASALVDTQSGLALATLGAGIDLKLAASGNAEVMRAKRETAKLLGLTDTIKDILITLSGQYHLIRPLACDENLFLYLVLDRQKSDLATARHALKRFESGLRLS